MMVPTGRLELPQLAPLAPQASVSTNSTTSASENRSANASGLTQGSPAAGAAVPPALPAWAPRSRRPAAAAGAASVRRSPAPGRAASRRARRIALEQVSEAQAVQHENRGKYRRHARQPVLAPRAPNTVPEAPAPKPAPASAPLPRCTSTRADDGEAPKETSRIVESSQHLCVPDSARAAAADREEFLGLERGAADEPAIDVRHRKELRGIPRLHAAAILDAHEGGDISIVARDPPADVRMDVFGLLRGRSLAGADGPDRLIGDDGAREGGDAGQIEHGIELAVDHLESAAGFALGQQFAHAQDRRQSAASTAANLRATSWSVSPNRARRSEWPTIAPAQPTSLQHGGGHLAGEGALGFGADILRPQADARTGQRAATLGQIDERRAHPDFRRRVRQACARWHSTSAAFSAREPCIFQLPAMIWRRMLLSH